MPWASAWARTEDERQLRYVYERDLLAFPTMSVVLGYPGFWVRDPRTGIDWIKVVHGEQRLAMHAPLPASGVIIGRSRNTHVVDKGADKGALVITERTLHDEAGACLATLTQTTFCRGDGGFGGDDGPCSLPATPQGVPDLRCELRISRRRRCSTGSTRTAIRCTPIPRWRGVRVIRAQSCTALHLRRRRARHRPRLLRLRRLAPGQPERALSAPVYPGETLQCDIWRLPDGQVRFLARALERGVVVMSNGTAEVRA